VLYVSSDCVCGLVASPPESTSLNDWSVSQVCDWLYSIGSKKETVDIFRDANITGLSVAKLELENLKELKIKMGDRDIILRHRDKRLAAEQEFQEQLSRFIPSDSDMIDVKKCLEEKFLHLLCGGEEVLRGDHYLILVLNAPASSMTAAWIEKNLSFLRNLEWKVVFDFDSQGKICEFFRCQSEVKITMPDEFDTDSDGYTNEQRQTLVDDIKNSLQPSWIFANGYDSTEPLPFVQWKRKRSESFKKAVQFFKSQIPPGRATVVFLLFSKDTDIMVEAADEFFMCFEDNWLCVSESNDIGCSFTEELQRRKWVESPEERTVTGLSWSEINNTVTAIKPARRQTVCMIPSSTGVPVILDPGTISELSEIVVLGCNECEDEVMQLDHAQRESLMRAEEIRFYRGGSPSWWNFYFKNQICRREIYNGLHSKLKKVLASTSNDTVVESVERVRILHQPGAGGTTSAKHILWDLRKEYRVAVVNNCEDHRSSEKISRLAKQILKLYQHEEREDAKCKPVLLFLDNPEEETEYCLIGELTEMAKRIRRYGEQNQLVCVFLVCLRLTQIDPVQDSKKGRTIDSNRVSLHHSLSDRERKWFQSKDKALQEEFEKALKEEDKRSTYVEAVSPKLLISFNILKENFDKDFIQRMVREFVANIKDEKERKLLKYISLINAYDLDFRPLPLAAFDNMMATVEWKPCAKKKNVKKQQHVLWENKLSGALRILMNESSERGMGYIQSLRLTNPLLAKEVLNCLKKKESSGEVERVCDIALELFNCEEVFKVQSCPRERLMYVIKDVLNKRRRRADRTPEQKFAPMILDIMENEDNGAQNACRVLEEGYNLTEDAFVAQTLARLFIERKLWDPAFTFAKVATNMVPKNSYLWDTYGCVYEKKLLAEREKYTSDVTWLASVVQLGMDGIEIFRHVQYLSEQEKFPNTAGYYGELRIIINVLECLKCFDEFRYVACLKKFLIEDDYVPQHVVPLNDMFGHNYVEEIKKLKENVVSVLHYLEDEKLQLRSDKFHRHEHDNLDKMKLKFNDYFGEDSDDPPEGLSEQKECYYRQRRIFKLASNNTKGIFELRWVDDGLDRLVKIRDIVSKNIRSKEVDAVDYMTAINVELALRSLISATPQLQSEFTCNFDDILQWSLKLYNARRKVHATYLEPYLFLTMFNWPRENSKPLVTPHVIEIALKEWKDAYNSKYRRQRDEDKPFRKKDVTMFFLANGNGIESIYTWYEEQGFSRTNDAAFWKEADATKNLQRFKGTVRSGGHDVEYCFEGSTLHIQTSYPLDRVMWNKKVVFILGFSWIGPKAFDVRLDLDSTTPSSEKA